MQGYDGQFWREEIQLTRKIRNIKPLEIEEPVELAKEAISEEAGFFRKYA